MFKFKRLVSIFVFSVLAFGGSAQGVIIPRFAKVVLLGGYGTGKTTFKNIVNKDFSKVKHSFQFSYAETPVFYKNNKEFTFNEEETYDNKDYKHVVFLDICDTVSESKCLQVVDEFALKGTNVALILADARNFLDIERISFATYDPFEKQIRKLRDIPDCRIILVLTHMNDVPNEYQDYIKDMCVRHLKSRKDLIGNQIDAIAVLTIQDNDSKDSKIKSVKTVLDLVASSVWRYGIEKLPKKDKTTDYIINENKVYDTKCNGEKVLKETKYELKKE